MSIHNHLTVLLNEGANINQLIAYEQGELSGEDTLKLFSDLVKSGLA